MKHWLLFVLFLVGSLTAEAHFTLAPKIEIMPKAVEQPDALFIRYGDIEASRGDFLEYLQRLTAFDTKYQKVQANFSTHFDLLRGVAFYHPENVHQYIDSIKIAKSNKALHAFAIKAWFSHQADIFTRLLPIREAAKRSQLIKSPQIQPVLDLYVAGAKTALLEELIILGDMQPSVAGITRFVNEKSDGFQELLNKGVEVDTEVTPAEEQRRLKKRWSDFRKDVLKHTQQVRYDHEVKSPDMPHDTLIAEVNAHKLDWGDYLAVYGLPPTNNRWVGLKKSNVSRLILFYAMADLADHLGLAPERIQRDIRISTNIYLMGAELARQAAPRLLDKPDKKLSLKDVSDIMQYPKVVEVKDWLLSRKQEKEPNEVEVFIKKEFLGETDWSLKRVLAPKHSIHL
jgi:hypothetical protein